MALLGMYIYFCTYKPQKLTIVHMSFNYVGSFPIHLKKILVSRIHTILLARQEIPSNMYRGYTYRGMYYVYCMMHI